MIENPKYQQRKIFMALQPGEYGGAILEYILVTGFAAVVGMAALSFVGSIVKEQLTKISQKMGTSDSIEFSLPWDESP